MQFGQSPNNVMNCDSIRECVGGGGIWQVTHYLTLDDVHKADRSHESSSTFLPSFPAPQMCPLSTWNTIVIVVFVLN